MRGWLVTVVLVIGVLGCAGGKPAVTPVEGTAMLGKAPAGNLLLQFIPTDGTKGTVGGSAVTDKTGNYVVTSDDGQQGLPPGNYVVVVVDNALSTDEEPDGRPKKAQPVNRVSQRYTQTGERNPLQIRIEAGKSNYPIVIE